MIEMDRKTLHLIHQKGVLRSNQNHLNQNVTCSKEKVIDQFKKEYLKRKDKKEMLEFEKYYGGYEPKRKDSFPTLSENFDSLHPSSVHNRRPFSKASSYASMGRAGSSRSNYSNKEN